MKKGFIDRKTWRKWCVKMWQIFKTEMCQNVSKTLGRRPPPLFKILDPPLCLHGDWWGLVTLYNNSVVFSNCMIIPSISANYIFAHKSVYMIFCCLRQMQMMQFNCTTDANKIVQCSNMLWVWRHLYWMSSLVFTTTWMDWIMQEIRSHDCLYRWVFKIFNRLCTSIHPRAFTCPPSFSGQTGRPPNSPIVYPISYGPGSYKVINIRKCTKSCCSCSRFGSNRGGTIKKDFMNFSIFKCGGRSW